MRKKTQGLYQYNFERINPEIAQRHNRLSFLCQHYSGSSAIIQKIEALSGRSQTQSRDVFDIFILILGGYAKDLNLNKLDKKLITKSREAVLSLNYNDFQGQVLEYLDEDDRKLYIKNWNEIQEKVAGILTL